MKLYLACPYTHPDPAVREYRFRMATLKAAELISEGNIVFSPLTMTVPMEKMAGLPQTFSYWKRLNFAFIDWCEEMRILNIEGVENSEGVQGEIQYAESIGRPHCMTPPPIEPKGESAIGFTTLEDAMEDALTAPNILTEKAEIYGEPEIAMENIGKIWGGILSQHTGIKDGGRVPANVVALMLAGMKLARLARTPEHEDSMKDAHGYLDIVKKCL